MIGIEVAPISPELLFAIGFGILVLGLSIVTIYSGTKGKWFLFILGCAGIILGYLIGSPVLIKDAGVPIAITGALLVIQDRMDKSEVKGFQVRNWALRVSVFGMMWIFAGAEMSIYLAWAGLIRICLMLLIGFIVAFTLFLIWRRRRASTTGKPIQSTKHDVHKP